MLSELQRGQVTPLGQRSSVSRSRHLSSSPNCSISFGRFISALKDLVSVFISMPKSKKKPAHKMTDKELLRDLFHPKLLNAAEKEARKHRKKSRKSTITRPN